MRLGTAVDPCANSALPLSLLIICFGVVVAYIYWLSRRQAATYAANPELGRLAVET
jgi:cbb3-type cytochrome oxidase subunit 3